MEHEGLRQVTHSPSDPANLHRSGQQDSSCVPAQTIIECRRVLSWTYTYGYYALEDMDHKASSSKGNSSAEENQRFFFEFLQAVRVWYKLRAPACACG
eukprot:scaffold173284_cov18-Tisochrysis_lutea.AAC.1